VAGFRLYDVAGTSLTVADSLSSESSNAIAFDLNAVGDVAFLAWETDLTVQAVSLAGGAISSLATVAIESGTFLTALEVESSAGNFAYVSNEVESLVVTIGADNALSLLTPNPFAGVASLVNAYGIAIQP
jgi:hypothetical protein